MSLSNIKNVRQALWVLVQSYGLHADVYVVFLPNANPYEINLCSCNIYMSASDYPGYNGKRKQKS